MPDFVPPDPDFERRVRADFARQKAMALIGAELTRVEPGRVTIEVPYREDLTQQHGFFHAGIISTAADSAGGYAGYSLMPADSQVLSVEFKVNLLAPADGERILAHGRAVRSGRNITVCELEVEVVKNGARKVCSVGLQTLMCVQGRALRAPPR